MTGIIQIDLNDIVNAQANQVADYSRRLVLQKAIRAKYKRELDVAAAKQCTYAKGGLDTVPINRAFK